MSNHRTRQRASSPPSNDPTTDFGVSLQVREEACEAGWAKTQPYGPTLSRTEVGDVVDAAIPVIAEAAYKEAKARIESLGSEYNPNWTPEENRAYGIGLKAALNALDGNPQDQVADNRAAALAAIDKEGETNE